MINPLKAIEMIGNLAQATKIVDDLKKFNPDGDEKPQVFELIDKAKGFVAKLDELNKEAIEMAKLYAECVEFLRERLEKKA